MKYQPEIREIEPVTAAFLPYQGLVTEANKIFPRVFQAIRGQAGGAPFFSYIEMNPVTGYGRLDLCVPTAVIPNGNGVERKEFPRTRAVCVIHTGPYDTMADAYAAIEQYASEHGLQLELPFREVFLKGPGMLFKGNPQTYITEIQVPIREAFIECD